MSFTIQQRCPICGTNNSNTLVPTVDRYKFVCKACKFVNWQVITLDQFQLLEAILQ